MIVLMKAPHPSLHTVHDSDVDKDTTPTSDSASAPADLAKTQNPASLPDQRGQRSTPTSPGIVAAGHRCKRCHHLKADDRFRVAVNQGTKYVRNNNAIIKTVHHCPPGPPCENWATCPGNDGRDGYLNGKFCCQNCIG